MNYNICDKTNGSGRVMYVRLDEKNKIPCLSGQGQGMDGYMVMLSGRERLCLFVLEHWHRSGKGGGGWL